MVALALLLALPRVFLGVLIGVERVVVGGFLALEEAVVELLFKTTALVSRGLVRGLQLLWHCLRHDAGPRQLHSGCMNVLTSNMGFQPLWHCTCLTCMPCPLSESSGVGYARTSVHSPQCQGSSRWLCSCMPIMEGKHACLMTKLIAAQLQGLGVGVVALLVAGAYLFVFGPQKEGGRGRD